MDRVIILQEILQKIAGINVLFNAALEATEKWQRDFLKEEYFRVRTELFDDVIKLLKEGENE